MALIRSLAIAALAASLSGCFVTKEEGNAMQSDIEKLKTKATKNSEEAADLRKATEDAETKMKQLVEDATKVVTRNSANIGQDVDRLKSDLAALTGRVANVEDRLTTDEGKIDALAKAVDALKAAQQSTSMPSAPTVSKPAPLPATPEALFAEARKNIDAKQWVEARRLLSAFVSTYPSDTRAGAAQFLIGETFLAESKYQNAIGAYSKVIDDYPKSESVPDAMFKAGLAFYALKYCADAKIYFQELLKRYPRTEWKKDANEQLHKLAKDMRNHEVCTQ